MKRVLDFSGYSRIFEEDKPAPAATTTPAAPAATTPQAAPAATDSGPPAASASGCSGFLHPELLPQRPGPSSAISKPSSRATPAASDLLQQRRPLAAPQPPSHAAPAAAVLSYF